MICRLCLVSLDSDLALSLFDNTDEFGHSDIVQLIRKFFHLEINLEDNISTYVCRVCVDHLEDFDRFYDHVEKKQESLRQHQKTEFFEVKCIELPSDQNSLECDKCVNDSFSTLNSLKLETVEEHTNVSTTTVVPCKIKGDPNVDGYMDFEKDVLSSDEDIPLQQLRNVAKKKAKKQKEKKLSTHASTNANTTISSNNIELNCELCKKNIGNFEELIKHFTINHAGQEAYIKCCGKIIKKKENYARHINWHRNPEKYKCNECDIIMCSSSSLKTHMESKHSTKESSNGSFNCDKCERVFSSNRRLQNHCKSHDKNARIELNCHICGKLYTNETRLKRHIQGLHDYVYPYKCSACNEPFNFKEDLDNHTTQCKNKTLLERLSTGKEESELTECICKTCHKIFSGPKQLKRHVEFVHEKVAPFVCDQCGKNFKFKPAFQKHLLEHSGIVDPPVQCEVCGKWLKNKNSHRLHQYRHGDTLSKCHLCDRKCPSRRALKGHIENVHRHEKDYKCSYCEKSFKSSNNLEEHIATHTGAQLYTCPHCPKETRSRSNMYVHIKTNHVEEWIKSKLARSYDPSLNATNK